jgi:hypothetical protein
VNLIIKTGLYLLQNKIISELIKGSVAFLVLRPEPDDDLSVTILACRVTILACRMKLIQWPCGAPKEVSTSKKYFTLLFLFYW